MHWLIAIAAGVLFGFGLDLSRMTNPDRVLGFLDIMGTWDPTLMFVLAGALITSTVGFRLLAGGKRPWFGERFQLPTKKDIDLPLVVGSALFGIGWGVVGYCPGPGIAALTHGAADPAWFVAGMAGGMLIYSLARR